MSTSRLFQMLYILLENDRISAAELAQRLEVSVRTVYRDAQALCEAGVPLYAERGRTGGLSILPTFKLNKSFLSEQERANVLAALSAAVQTGAQDEQTLHKLSTFFGAERPDWVRIDFSDWSGQRDALLGILREAILKKRRLSFEYYGESNIKTLRTVCPVLLWFKSSSWYLVAYCLDRRAARTFKLTRMKHAAIIPGDFPPEAFLCEPPAGHPEESTPLVSLSLQFDACAAYRVFDEFEPDEITQLDDGSLRVCTAFPPGAWISSMILSYGPHVRVLAPDALREEILNLLKNTLALYQS